jgi:hypothetical protein
MLISYEYRWSDGVKIKKPIQVNAPEYVNLLLNWVEDQFNDESIFPTDHGIVECCHLLLFVVVIFIHQIISTIYFCILLFYLRFISGALSKLKY